MTTSTASALSIVFCLLVASASQPASAADKKAAPPRAKAASAVMGKEELRQCLAQKESVRAEGEALGKERDTLGAAKAAIETRSTELSDRLVALDRTSASAVDAHNADVVEREKAVDAFKLQVDAFNAKAIAARDHQLAFEQGCGNKLYEVKDETAIRKSK